MVKDLSNITLKALTEITKKINSPDGKLEFHVIARVLHRGRINSYLKELRF